MEDIVNDMSKKTRGRIVDDVEEIREPRQGFIITSGWKD
jgi:hypothetical protein